MRALAMLDRLAPSTRSRRFIPLLAALAVLAALVVPNLSTAQLPAVPTNPESPTLNTPPVRDSEPVILKGSSFPGWSAPANQTAKLPLMDLTHCQSFDEKAAHNHNEPPA